MSFAPGKLRHCVGDAGSKATPGAPSDESNPCVGVAGPQPVLVIVRQELGFVRRHVHVHRTIALASLAGEAQIERVENLFALPAVADHVAVHHLEKQAGAAARGMFFFHRGAVTRAHGALFLTPAFADADAPQRRMRETALVVDELKMRRGFLRSEVRCRAEDSS